MSDNILPIWFRECREPSCRKRIGFHPERKSTSGALIPLNPENGSRHQCSNSLFQRRVNAAEGKQSFEEPSKAEVTGYFNDERLALDAIQFIQGINNRLHGFQLTISRIPRTEGQTTLG